MYKCVYPSRPCGLHYIGKGSPQGPPDPKGEAEEQINNCLSERKVIE